MRTNFLSTPRKSRKPQPQAGQSCLVKESRVKSQGGDTWDKTTDIRSASIPGLDTRKALLGVPRERSGADQSWVGPPTAGILGMAAWHAKAWPTGILTTSGWHLPLQAIPFCFGRCRGVISEGLELTLAFLRREEPWQRLDGAPGSPPAGKWVWTVYRSAG